MSKISELKANVYIRTDGEFKNITNSIGDALEEQVKNGFISSQKAQEIFKNIVLELIVAYIEVGDINANTS